MGNKVINSKKNLIQKMSNGYKLETLQQHRRTLYYLTNYRDTELTVASSLIRKLEMEGILDRNLELKNEN